MCAFLPYATIFSHDQVSKLQAAIPRQRSLFVEPMDSLSPSSLVRHSPSSPPHSSPSPPSPPHPSSAPPPTSSPPSPPPLHLQPPTPNSLSSAYQAPMAWRPISHLPQQPIASNHVGAGHPVSVPVMRAGLGECLAAIGASLGRFRCRSRGFWGCFGGYGEDV